MTDRGSFLARYLAGEHEAVWSELTALGPAAREPPFADDALAVARETMRRARRNVELIIRRLDTIGYRFWNGKQGRPFGPPRKITFGAKVIEAQSLDAMLAHMFREARQIATARVTSVMVEQLHNIYRMAIYPYQDRERLAKGERLPLDAEATRLFETAKKVPPGQMTSAILDRLDTLHRRAIDQAVERWKERLSAAPPPKERNSDHLKDKKVFRPPAKKDAALVRALEKKGVFLPLSLRAWIEEVGDVNLAGAHPRLCFWEDETFPGTYADPLMVTPQLFLFEVEDWQEGSEAGEPLDALLGWDAKAKARLTVEDEQLDYGYTIMLPDAAADAVLRGAPHGTTFVDCLRLAFRWGGFPGWERDARRPEEDLAKLADGLSPI